MPATPSSPSGRCSSSLSQGQPAGSRVDLPAGGGTVDVTWEVASVNVPIAQIEIIVGGLVAEQVIRLAALSAQRQRVAPDHRLDLDRTARSRELLRPPGRYRRPHQRVQVVVGEQPIFVESDAMAVLEQIEGAIAYVDTLAPRPEARRCKQLRATLETAHNRLHQRMHRKASFISTRRCMGMTGRASTASWHSDDSPGVRSRVGAVGRRLPGVLMGSGCEFEDVHRFRNDPVRVDGRLHWDILRLLHEIKQGIARGCIAPGWGDRESGHRRLGVDFG